MHMPGLHRFTERQHEIMELAGRLAARFAERAAKNDVESVFPYREFS